MLAKLLRLRFLTSNNTHQQSRVYSTMDKENKKKIKDEDIYQNLLKILEQNPRFIKRNVDCSEIEPGIFIGDRYAAKKLPYLQSLGISHVLNAADGSNFLHTSNRTAFKYLGLRLQDMPSEDISRYFHTAADFIEEALSSGGKVFVHCMEGISRSATCVIAYLMIKRHMCVEDAVCMVRNNRHCTRPNNGFLRQLITLNNQLRMNSK